MHVDSVNEYAGPSYSKETKLQWITKKRVYQAASKLTGSPSANDQKGKIQANRITSTILAAASLHRENKTQARIRVCILVTQPEVTFLFPPLHQSYLKTAKWRWLGQSKSLSSWLQQFSKDPLSTLKLCGLIPGIPQRWPKLQEDNKGGLGTNKDKPRFKKKAQIIKGWHILVCKGERDSVLIVFTDGKFPCIFCFVINRHRKKRKLLLLK